VLPTVRVETEAKVLEELVSEAIAAKAVEVVEPQKFGVEAESKATGSNNEPSINPSEGEVGSIRDSLGFFRPAWEYEYDETSLEERLVEPIMDALALIPSNYLGQSTAGCIPIEDMTKVLIQIQTMVSFF
jgi:hypothetical protein